MARKTKEKEPSIFRFMCIKTDNKNYHLDFSSKDEVLQYVDELDDDKIEWYGVYELDPACLYQKSITHKRLIPHDDTIPLKYLKESRPDIVEKPTRRKRKKAL